MDDMSEETVGEQKINHAEEEKSLPRVNTELRHFIDSITSVSDTLEITIRAIFQAFDKTKDQFMEFLNRNIIEQEINGETNFVIEAECYQTYRDLTKQLSTYDLASKTVPKSFVMALIS